MLNGDNEAALRPGGSSRSEWQIPAKVDGNINDAKCLELVDTSPEDPV